MNEDNTPSSELVQISYQFIQELTREYGGDQGMETWNKIAATLPGSVQAAIFHAMMTGGGEFGARITVTGLRPVHKFVQCIKMVRTVTNCGLKEAKVFVDRARDENITQTLEVVGHIDRAKARAMLVAEGFIL